MIEWFTNRDPVWWFFTTGYICIVGLWVIVLLLTKRAKRKRLILASPEFRSAIDIDRIAPFREYHLLRVLDTGLVPEDREQFEGEFFKHKRAVHKYRTYLPWLKRFRFRKAWKEYHGGDEDHPDLLQYCTRDDGPELLRKRLEKLLTFHGKAGRGTWQK